jgi:hypothetical protein
MPRGPSSPVLTLTGKAEAAPSTIFIPCSRRSDEYYDGKYLMGTNNPKHRPANTGAPEASVVAGCSLPKPRVWLAQS